MITNLQWRKEKTKPDSLKFLVLQIRILSYEKL